MSDLIENVQEVYKRWESRSTPNFSSRPKRGAHSHYSSSRNRYENTDQSRIQRYKGPVDRYRRQTKLPRFNLPKYDGLAQFKMAPCVVAESKQRPFMGSPCAKCVPLSRAAFQDTSVFCLSICNVLRMPYFKSDSFSSDIFHALNWKSSSMYPDISIKVLENKRVVSSIQSQLEKGEIDANEGNTICTEAELNYTATKILKRMKTYISATLLWCTAKTLRYVLNKMLDGVLVHKGHIEILKSVAQENIPFIYLPLHRSHFDYILVSFILHMNSLKAPLVAAGDNLYVPFFGDLLKFLGAFFIRRELDQKREKDYLYRAVLQSYIMESLKAGHSLEFFIEGGRSRSGKPRLPKTGLLSMVVNSVLEGSVEDAYVIPVSVSYEKIIEGNFIAEQLGKPKEKESFYSIICSIWKIMHLNYGNIRLNFCQPFSLKEFLQSYKLDLKFPSGDTPPESSSSLSSEIPDVIFNDVAKSQLRSVVNSLARHVVYDATFCSSVMSTHLVAFLFISQYRKGATQQQLQSSMDLLRRELLNKKRDTGFSGESVPVIKRAIELLGKDLITSETIEMEWTSSDLENNNVKVVVYTPVVKLPHVLELQYYANSVVPIFLLDSIVVNAIYALVDVEICHFRHCDSKLYVYREKLIDKAIELNNMLQFEFLAVSPCVDISLSFSEVLDELIEKDCLHVAGMGIYTGCNVRQLNKKSHVLSFETSDEEDEKFAKQEQQLKIDLKEESIKHMEFLRNILSPYIESYWLSACSLLKLIDEVKEEKVFIQEMQLTAQEKLYKGLLAYEESFSADTLRNALKLFEHWHVIESYLQDGLKIIYLEDSYNCCERINDIIARIEEFRK